MWVVNLLGVPSDLERLPSLFQTARLRIKKRPYGFTLTSSRLRGLNRDVATEAARRLVTSVNAFTRLIFPNHKPITVGSIRDTKGGVVGVLLVKVRARIDPIDHDVTQTGPPSWLSLKLQQFADTDPMVQRAFLILQSVEIGWDELYKLHELILSDGAGMLLRELGYTRTQLKRFTQTANSYSALGVDARHAHDRVPSPPAPLPLKEAKVFILRWCRAWIQHRAESR